VKTRILIMLCMMGLEGCFEVPLQDALRQLKSPAYAQSFTTDNHRIEVRLVPAILRVLQQAHLDSTRILTHRLIDSLMPQGITYGTTFILKLSPKDSASSPGIAHDVIYGNISGYPNYQETLKAYQTGLADKIWLEVNGKKIPMLNYEMENTFGMDPSRSFMLLFPDLETSEKSIQVKLVLDDIVPGLGRKKLDWNLPVGKYEKIL